MFGVHFLYYRTCQLACTVETCYLHILFLVFISLCFFYLLVYRGERREKILQDARLGS